MTILLDVPVKEKRIFASNTKLLFIVKNVPSRKLIRVFGYAVNSAVLSNHNSEYALKLIVTLPSIFKLPLTISCTFRPKFTVEDEEIVNVIPSGTIISQS